MLLLLQAELQAEQARRLAAEGSSASQAAVSSGMGLKARKLEGDEGSAKKTEAAEFARDGLLRLGPTFVKLGQVGPEAY